MQEDFKLDGIPIRFFIRKSKVGKVIARCYLVLGLLILESYIFCCLTKLDSSDHNNFHVHGVSAILSSLPLLHHILPY